jgi:Icc-related predicted phosphoesterase
MHIKMRLLFIWLSSSRSSVLVISIVLSFIFSIGSQIISPQPSAAAELTISAVGDFGCNSNTGKTVSNIKNKGADLVLALGDYSYQPTAKCWFDKIKPIQSKTRINIGNHEDDTKKLLDSYLKPFGLSKQYYSFDFKNVHVLTMATQLDYKKGSKQFNFVKNDLEKAAQDPKIKWIIVNFHRPTYTSPNGCSASSCEGSKTLRDVYHPLFDKNNVDLVLAGHVHNYQRTFPLEHNDDKPSKPTITSTNKQNYNNPDGEIYAIVGTGGINFYSLDGKKSFIASQQASRFGVLHLDITDKKLAGTFLGNDGSVRDEFSITKSGANSNVLSSNSVSGSSSSTALRASSNSMSSSPSSPSSSSMNPF